MYARLLLAFTFVFASLAGARAASEYRVAIGDVLELSASSVAEFRHRATVGLDGEITLPLVGEIRAAQRPLSELREIVRDAVPRKSVRRRGADGSEHEVVIDADEISLVIVEYGPVYVNGDVARPGSYPYRPGLTVRQALSLAGGYDVVRSRTENPFLQTPDLRSQHESLQNELVRDQARIARVQTELGRPNRDAEIPSSSPIASSIKALEADQLTGRLADLDNERTHLSGIVRSLASRLELLNKQVETEQQRARIDQEELDRVQGLFEKGMVPITRLTDVRRLILLSASRATDIETTLERTRVELQEARRRLQKLDDERRLTLTKELQESQLQLAATQSRINAAMEKMFYLGALRSRIGRTTSGAADLLIVRRGPRGPEHLTASEETELLPSDVVEVALRLDVSDSPAAIPSAGMERAPTTRQAQQEPTAVPR